VGIQIHLKDPQMAVIIRRRKQVRCKLKEAFKRPLLSAVRPRHNIYVCFALNTRRAGMFTTTVLYVTPLASTHISAVITCARFGIAVLFVLIASLLGRPRPGQSLLEED
jgi:hypothetical protein